jgi:hypothetical protein
MFKKTLLVLALVVTATAARADAITEWNAFTAQVIASSTHTGPAVLIDFAAVHAAMHDAVQGIEHRYRPYRTEIDGSGSPVAAAAKAARDVLVQRFPSQTAVIDTRYHAFLVSNGLAADDRGVAAGAAAAAGIIDARTGDGAFPSTPPAPFIGSEAVGAWRPTPAYLGGAAFVPMATPWLANVTPFAVDSPSQFRPKPAPALDSKEYAEDFNEVKAVGGSTSTARTQEQTNIALFWADNTPILWNRTLRAISATYVTDLGDNARLFALGTMSAADALITCWDAKIHYNYWRPVTAIHEADHDGNAATEADPTWRPLINTPNYPDYTSGANSLTGAMTRTLQLLFGRDDLPVTITSTTASLPVDKRTRSFERISDVASEVVDARIYLGIHFRFADTTARKQGERIAQWAFAHHLKPIDDDERGIERGKLQ